MPQWGPGVTAPLRAGTIGLVYTKGVAGRFIRVAQEGHWNHVVIAKGDGQCYSAEPKSGVRLRPQDLWDDVAWLVNEPFTDAEGQARVAYCETQLGTPYNWPAILAFSRWWIPTPAWFVHWAATRDALICSELAVNAIRASGKSFLADRPSATVAPAGVDIEFRRQGW